MKFNRILIVGWLLFSVSSAYSMQRFLNLFKSQEQIQAEQREQAQLELQQKTSQLQQAIRQTQIRIATLKREIVGHKNEVQRLLHTSQALRGSSLASFQLNRHAFKQELSLQHSKEKSLQDSLDSLAWNKIMLRRIVQSQSRRIEQVNPKKRKRDAGSSISGEDTQKHTIEEPVIAVSSVVQPLPANLNSSSQDSLEVLRHEFDFSKATSSNLSSSSSPTIDSKLESPNPYNFQARIDAPLDRKPEKKQEDASSVQSSDTMAETDKVIRASNALIHKMMPQIKKMAQETKEKYNENMQQFNEEYAELTAQSDEISAVLAAHLPQVDGQELDDMYRELGVPQTTSTSSSSSSTESREQTIINALIRKNFSANNAAVAAPMVAAYEGLTKKMLNTDEEIAAVALDFLK